MTNAIFPGTFDPITRHLDIAERSAIFDHVTIGVYEDSDKNTLLNINERMFKSSIDHLKNVSVSSYKGLTVNFKKNNSKVIIRGLRIENDFEYERGMALINRDQ